MGDQPHSSDSLLHPGTRVEVRTRFDQRTWVSGFEVVSSEPDGYLLRRVSDMVELPVMFDPQEVRRERRRETWWV